ncbi:MAG: GAF domain-containing protein [Anaerolineae bacterium]|nr:GAF domain-containing protein [Anaerolineae bacterium]
MKKGLNSLLFKISLAVVLVELSVLTLAGLGYGVQFSRQIIVGFVSVVIVASGVIVYLLNIIILNRIRGLIKLFNQVQQGDLTARLTGPFSSDEMGVLQMGANVIISRLGEVITTLEQMKLERDQAFAQRSSRLEAVAEVANAIVSIRDLESLLSRITHLISGRFGYEQVRIFLLDVSGEYVALRAANSEEGQRMLERGYKVRVGASNIVGDVAQSRVPRVVADREEDAVAFDHPDSSDIRSELALPLVTGERLLGVLDIQSTEEAVFTDVNVNMLLGLVSQVAVAIDNARLIMEVQEVAESQRRAYGELSRAAWEELSRSQDLGYLARDTGLLVSASGQWQSELIQAKQQGEIVQVDASTVVVPVKVRGEQALGVVKFRKPDGAGEWTPRQVALLETLSDRLGQALESARFYEDTQRAATREQLLREISERVRNAVDVDSVLRTAVQEIGRVLDRPVFVYLSDEQEMDGTSK